MRVRITLEEKGLQWTSHHLNTRTGEHITPEYFGINPNGLVPALIHDGEVWIESCDIIRYLDDRYPEPRLTLTDDKQIVKLTEWLSLASRIHVTAVKTYIYASRPRDKRRKTPEELERYRSLQTNEELLVFHARSSSEDGISEADRRLHAGASRVFVCSPRECDDLGPHNCRAPELSKSCGGVVRWSA
jgi:GST-like protein